MNQEPLFLAVGCASRELAAGVTRGLGGRALTHAYPEGTSLYTGTVP